MGTVVIPAVPRIRMLTNRYRDIMHSSQGTMESFGGGDGPTRRGTVKDLAVQNKLLLQARFLLKHPACLV